MSKPVTTLCYIEQDGKYLMLHRTKKKQDINGGKWIGVGGHLEEGESIEECAGRELREETGLYIKKICKILPPAYAAPDLSDSSAWVVIAEVEGEFNPQTEADEYIRPLLADRKQLEKLLETEKFSGRAQLMAYFFCKILRENRRK